jgi:hypothetical protein
LVFCAFEKVSPQRILQKFFSSVKLRFLREFGDYSRKKIRYTGKCRFTGKEVQQFLEKEISGKARINEFVIVTVGMKPNKMYLNSSRPGQNDIIYQQKAADKAASLKRFDLC